MDASLETWQWLLSPAGNELRNAAAAVEDPTPQALSRLRRLASAERVAVALELARARRRAGMKFPVLAPRLVADVQGVEQASSLLVGRAKAVRFAQAGVGEEVFDLCCGIGGDAIALAARVPVCAVDLNPVRAWMCGCNLELAEADVVERGPDAGSRSAPPESGSAEFIATGLAISCAYESAQPGFPAAATCGPPRAASARVADVAALELPRAALVHIDPARRGPGRKRAATWRDQQPGPAVLVPLLARQRGVALKLGPGLPFEELPDLARHELELISEHGRLVQAVLWSGDLARHPGARVATRWPGGVSVVGMPEEVEPLPEAERDDLAGRTLLEPDPALERARLLGVHARGHDLRELAPGLGLLVGEGAVPDDWYRGYAVRACLPWRAERVAGWLADADLQVGDIKTRGGEVDPERARRALGAACQPSGRATLFVLRLGTRRVALVTERLASTSGSPLK